MDFAAEDEMLVGGGDAGEGVVRVDESPVLAGVAVVVEGVVLGCVVEVEPLALAAVEILGGIC